MGDVDVASLASPSSKLRLNIPTVSHSALVPDELVTLIGESSSSSSSLTIVDVRSSDYSGGHIRGSVNVPFDTIESGCDALLSSPAAAFVFVCNSGKQRSPVAAELFLSKFREANSAAEPPRVYVLVGGFASFLNAYSQIAADKTVSLVDGPGAALISDFDATKWTPVNAQRTPSNAAAASAYQLAYSARIAD